jgi:hypothetical protein
LTGTVRRESVAGVSKSFEKVEEVWYFGCLASRAVRRESVEIVGVVKLTTVALAALVSVDRPVDDEVEELTAAEETEDTV